MSSLVEGSLLLRFDAVKRCMLFASLITCLVHSLRVSLRKASVFVAFRHDCIFMDRSGIGLSQV